VKAVSPMPNYTIYLKNDADGRLERGGVSMDVFYCSHCVVCEYKSKDAEIAKLRNLLEDHGPEGRNVTNAQHVKLREEISNLRNQLASANGRADSEMAVRQDAEAQVQELKAEVERLKVEMASVIDLGDTYCREHGLEQRHFAKSAIELLAWRCTALKQDLVTAEQRERGLRENVERWIFIERFQNRCLTSALDSLQQILLEP